MGQQQAFTVKSHIYRSQPTEQRNTVSEVCTAWAYGCLCFDEHRLTACVFTECQACQDICMGLCLQSHTVLSRRLGALSWL